MRITIDLSDEQSAHLQSMAERLGVQANELAQAAFVDQLAQPQDDFLRAAEKVLRKNRELYERLR
jgi:hypothetical protein